jgi:hypothetical protein
MCRAFGHPFIDWCFAASSKRVYSSHISDFKTKLSYVSWFISLGQRQLTRFSDQIVSSFCSSFISWRYSPPRARAFSFLKFLSHRLRHATVGRTLGMSDPVRRKNLYLTTHTHSQRTTIHVPGGTLFLFSEFLLFFYLCAFLHICFFVLIALTSSFVFLLYNTQNKHPCPRLNSSSQFG